MVNRSLLSLAAIWSLERRPTMHPQFVDAGQAFGRLGFVPDRNPVWATASDCASGRMVWPCVSHPPLSYHQTEGCIMAIVLSHLDDASSPPSLTVTCLSDNYHQNQLSYPPGSKGLCAGDWQAFHFPSLTAVTLFYSFQCSVYVSICSSFTMAC